jgi:hypothetical protein
MLTTGNEAKSPPRRAKAWLLAVLVIAGAASFLVIAGVLSFVVSPPTASASPSLVPTPTPTPPVLVGIDANPGSAPANTATLVGSVEQCRVVTNGETFTVDFWVKNIPSPGLEAFSGQLSYTSTRLKVTAYDLLSYKLGAGAGSSVSDLTNPAFDSVPDTDGTFTPSAADFGSGAGHSETGSGVLARITLQAIGNGTATLILHHVKLSDPAFSIGYGDTNSDGEFDGAIANAQIRIGGSCGVGGVSENPDVSALAGVTGEPRGSHGMSYTETALWTLLVAGAVRGAWWGRRLRRR